MCQVPEGLKSSPSQPLTVPGIGTPHSALPWSASPLDLPERRSPPKAQPLHCTPGTGTTPLLKLQMTEESPGVSDTSPGLALPCRFVAPEFEMLLYRTEG
ncbi:hypothetical protein KIL84_007206 [Mauremys mutica]|uniref:Uncharacterized protein n=1 Tax=Mauremys mutica TaxID=74926 RepID=A0A9D3X2S0_9SAUR|nr:hypothetical protein KIL84_007206 [Mauremys mutica]